MSHNYVLRLAYDGTHFFGWQKTPLGFSIEEVVEKKLEQILQHRVQLQAASRTDRGVHAEDQWVNFLSSSPIETAALKRSLNALLPSTIRTLHVYQMPFDFHPTLHVLAKEYHYDLSLGSVQMPRDQLVCWHVPYPLNLDRMRSASRHLIGTHDFSSFCNFRKNLDYQDTKRHIATLELEKLSEERLLIRIIGKHFLYKMVRNIVGTLVDVGKGKIDPDAIPAVLQARKRSLAGVTAPAHGLILKKIYYPQEWFHRL
jgi:tRNA pseudouridine38-40 synthase